MTTQNAAQRREQARIAYEANLRTCPSRQLMVALSDKWVILVLTALEPGSARFSELRRLIAGVSQKMLTQTLRNLERDGLVDRFVRPSVPVAVHYSLTPVGESLLDVVAALKGWAEQNMDAVLASRAAYAAREGQLSR